MTISYDMRVGAAMRRLMSVFPRGNTDTHSTSRLRCRFRWWHLLTAMAAASVFIVHEVYSHRRAWHEWRLEQEAIAELPHQSHDRLEIRLYPWWHYLLREHVDFTPYSRSMRYSLSASRLDLPVSVDKVLQLRFLRHLDLSDCEVSDASALRIIRLKHLDELFLPGNPISDSGLVGIEDNRQLVRVGLWSTLITDATIARLATMPSLEYLSISHTRVSDSCVPDLLAIPRLSELDIRETAITKTGTLELTKRCKTLRRLHISRHQSPVDAKPSDEMIQVGSLTIELYDY